MPLKLLVLNVFLFWFAIWLGCYLIARDTSKPYLVLSGLGLVAYALAFASDSLRYWTVNDSVIVWLKQTYWLLLALPALLWSGALLELLPEEESSRFTLRTVWRYTMPAFVVMLVVAAVNTPVSTNQPTTIRITSLSGILFGFVLMMPVFLSVLLLRKVIRAGWPRHSLRLLLVALLFTALSTGLLVFPAGLFPRWSVLVALGLDLGLLGSAIALLDAFQEGEALLPDVLRSFDYALFAGLLFGGQVLLVMWLTEVTSFSLVILLFAIVGTTAGWQVFSDPIQTAIDRIAFAWFPNIRQARAELRVAAGAIPRRRNALDVEAMDEDEFARLTRRALSHYGDLSRLASSPLTKLPLIEQRLADRGRPTDTLERAAELKMLLTESIARLKPRGDGDFGTSDEWRYYNVLYFPYVVGLKPYSRRADHVDLSEVEQEALDWFRTYVPERTFYHWQSSAADLVAQDLLDRTRRLDTTNGLID